MNQKNKKFKLKNLKLNKNLNLQYNKLPQHLKRLNQSLPLKKLMLQKEPVLLQPKNHKLLPSPQVNRMMTTRTLMILKI